MVKVVYGVDIFGDHAARQSRIIDTETKEFKTAQEAMAFASECTECINADQLMSVMGANTVDLPLDLQAEGLLLNKAEFRRYRDV